MSHHTSARLCRQNKRTKTLTVSSDHTRLDNVDTVSTLEGRAEEVVKLGLEVLVGKDAIVDDLLDLYAGESGRGLDVSGTDAVCGVW